MVLGVQVNELAAMGRVNRYPRHPFNIRHRPWVIQPFFIAPVLPGETMKNMLIQASAYTDPVGNRLIGWHLEHMFFYIRHRDIKIVYSGYNMRDEAQKMMLDPNFTVQGSLKTGTNRHYYHGGPNSELSWVKLCLNEVVQEYFREGSELFSDYTIETFPIAAVDRGRSGMNWMDSLFENEDVPAGPDPNASTSMQALSEAQTLYEQLMAAKFIDMSYEDYLATFGVKMESIDEPRPELIRELRAWETPVSVVTQGTGATSSAIKWTVADRANKARFFKEPGFLFGVSVARPKVYFSGQISSATQVMDTALSWLPAIYRDEVWSTLKEIADGYGPIDTAVSGTLNSYWLDIRDLLLYGEQFTNRTMGTAGLNHVTLPDVGIDNKRYCDLVDAKNMFVDTTNGGYIYQDGLVSLAIAGTQRDFT